MKNLLFLLSISLLLLSCSDSEIIGLEVQPPSDAILIGTNSNTLDLEFETKSIDSVRSDESVRMLLGEIEDPVFGYNKGSFFTQILPSENNIDIGDVNNLNIDSAILTYSVKNIYGDESEIQDILVYEIATDIYKDSIYFSNLSNHLQINDDNWAENSKLVDDSINYKLVIKLENNKISEWISSGDLSSNEAFLSFFRGFYVETQNGINQILSLDPQGASSNLKIYYHNINDPDSALTLEFSTGGDAARINIFNDKPIENLQLSTNNSYIQSMAGYKTLIKINNLKEIKDSLEGMTLNSVKISFPAINNSVYPSHKKLFLVRISENGDQLYLADWTIEGEAHFNGVLDSTNNKYTFNITRYFHTLMNNPSYTNQLELLPSLQTSNSNRTIIDNNNISIQIIYTEL